MGFTGDYRVLLRYSWFYWVFTRLSEFRLVSKGFTGFYCGLLSFIGFYWVLLGFTEFFLV